MLPLRDHLPTRMVPFVNYALIAANVVVFLLEASASASSVGRETLTATWGLVPAHVTSDPVTALITVFTSMFMHGSLQHIGGNMLFLWIFGDNVEDAMGHARYLAFYLLGGVCAATAQVLSDPSSMIPMVGASGAIAAVLAAYALLYPWSPITVWIFIILVEVPAWAVIGLFFVVNLWDAFANMAEGGVAFMAHVGGFIGGVVLLRFFMAGRERLDHRRWDRWSRRSDVR